MRDSLILMLIILSLLSVFAGPVGWAICIGRCRKGFRGKAAKISALVFLGYAVLLSTTVSVLAVGTGLPHSVSGSVFDLVFFGINILFIAYSIGSIIYMKKKCKSI